MYIKGVLEKYAPIWPVLGEQLDKFSSIFPNIGCSDLATFTAGGNFYTIRLPLEGSRGRDANHCKPDKQDNHPP